MTKFPLAWPTGWKRTPTNRRVRARFNKQTTKTRQSWRDQTQTETYTVRQDVTVYDGTQRVLGSLRLLGAVGEAIISTNLALRLDGLPRSNQGEPDDPGVAVYWRTTTQGIHKVMAIDQYDRIADNLAAIAATLEAMRAIERHGGAQILERAFTGFDALPEPNNWRHILGLTLETATLEKAEAAYKRLAMTRHPDHGGSHDQMTAINAAWKQAQRELGARPV